MQKGIVIGIVAAACLMMGCTGQKSQRLQQLEELEATNRAGKELLNDSLAEDLVDYFDRHGSSNERMRSRYMLGRTYYFMGELPRALEIYNEAADCADTTSADCDYKVLSRIPKACRTICLERKRHIASNRMLCRTRKCL